MQTNRVIVVMLRRPHSHPDETRLDPIWEVGSFGTTGCHSRNLMNPARLEELRGARFAFAQGGPLGVRLVFVTSPVSVRRLQSLGCGEVTWSPSSMPLRYDNSPCIVDNDGNSDIPLLLGSIANVQRTSWVAKFASAFRSSRQAVAGVVGAQLIAVFEKWRDQHPSSRAQTYVDALPWPPPKIMSSGERRAAYKASVPKTKCPPGVTAPGKASCAPKRRRGGC